MTNARNLVIGSVIVFGLVALEAFVFWQVYMWLLVPLAPPITFTHAVGVILVVTIALREFNNGAIDRIEARVGASSPSAVRGLFFLHAVVRPLGILTIAALIHLFT